MIGLTPQDGMSHAQRIVANCVLRSLTSLPGDVPDTERVPDAVWQSVVELAFRYDVVPLVYASVTASTDEVPETIRLQLRAGYLAACLRLEVELQPTIRFVVEALQSRGLHPVVLKGAALAHTAYPKPAQRTFADIDLLLTEFELGIASDVLSGLDYRPRGWEETDHHLQAVYAPEGCLGVELHSHLIPGSNPYLVDLDAMLDRAVVANVAGVNTKVLSPTDGLFLACLHLSYAHRYRRFPMRHLVDIGALTARSGDLVDWPLLVDMTTRSKTSGAVYWPLLLASSWLGAPIPPHVLRELAPPPRRCKILGTFASPRYILDNDVPLIRRPLHQILRLLSLYADCPLHDLATAAHRGVRGALAHSVARRYGV